MAQCACSPGRFNCHQDPDYNSNRSPCWTDFTRKRKNRIAPITGRGVRICCLLLGKQVSYGYLLAVPLKSLAHKVCYHLTRLGVLPLELNKLLIIVVVLSMALTPLLNEVGKKAADFIDDKFETEEVRSS